jgi:hypothetical protein
MDLLNGGGGGGGGKIQSNHQATGSHCDTELYNCTRLLLLPSGDAIVTVELLPFDPPFLVSRPLYNPF